MVVVVVVVVMVVVVVVVVVVVAIFLLPVSGTSTGWWAGWPDWPALRPEDTHSSPSRFPVAIVTCIIVGFLLL